eukprot:m.696931 g.696931  ORF g.696931 m.696931 type:complete len:126 (-) comp58674_c0_seq1:1642-2019(-)
MLEVSPFALEVGDLTLKFGKLIAFCLNLLFEVLDARLLSQKHFMLFGFVLGVLEILGGRSLLSLLHGFDLRLQGKEVSSIRERICVGMVPLHLRVESSAWQRSPLPAHASGMLRGVAAEPLSAAL